MSDGDTVEEWDVVVPDDGAELLAQLRRLGVRPGQRVHIRTTGAGLEGASDRVEALAESEVGSSTGDGPAHGLPAFVGSFASGQPDLAERSEEILQEHFPDR
jgi:hypothetical protein